MAIPAPILNLFNSLQKPVKCMASLTFYLFSVTHLSRDMRFPKMWYVQPANAQNSLQLMQTDQSHC